MAKKTPTPKPKSQTGKPAPAKPAAKKPAVKPAAQKPPVKASAPKPAKGPPAAKPAAAAKKPPATEALAKPATKSDPKGDAKPDVRADSKPVAPKPATKPEAKTAIKPDTKAVAKPDTKPEPEEVEASKAAPGGDLDPKKPVRKGITIVSPKPVRKAKPKTSPDVALAHAGRLLDPSNPARKPLIPSGPNASAPAVFNTADPEARAKSPFPKKELERFRGILLRKRVELVGDVSNMEQQALQGASGSLSHMPQHLAEQGSETYEQSLSLDLAAADRKLIREIDDAIKRIDEGTFGVCELTGKPIKPERLEELPWARYSIEAARELERRSIRS